MLAEWALKKRTLGEVATRKLISRNVAAFVAAIAKNRDAAYRVLRQKSRPLILDETDEESESEDDVPLKVRLQRRANPQEAESSTAVLHEEVEDARQSDIPAHVEREEPVHNEIPIQEIADTDLFVHPSREHRRLPLQQSDSSSNKASEEERDTSSDEPLSIEERDTEPAAIPNSMSNRGSVSTVSTDGQSFLPPRKMAPMATKGIRIVNEPKTQRRARWQHGDSPFSTLHARKTLEKRSQIEATPDIGALNFVGDLPATSSKPINRASNDNPYGRREIKQRREQESDTSASGSNIPAEPLRSFEVGKIPQVCAQWRLSSNCHYGDEKCRFMHRDRDANGQNFPLGDINGYVPEKFRNPPVTCHYWFMTSQGCQWKPHECNYAHYNTGWRLNNGPGEPKSSSRDLIAIDTSLLALSKALSKTAGEKNARTGRKIPRSEITCAFWANGKCTKTAAECKYQHYDTGLIARGPPGSTISPNTYERNDHPQQPQIRPGVLSRKGQISSVDQRHTPEHTLKHRMSTNDISQQQTAPPPASLTDPVGTEETEIPLASNHTNLPNGLGSTDKRSLSHDEPQQPPFPSRKISIDCQASDIDRRHRPERAVQQLVPIEGVFQQQTTSPAASLPDLVRTEGTEPPSVSTCNLRPFGGTTRLCGSRWQVPVIRSITNRFR